MKISYIVPVYNVANYIAACLESLINQTIDEKEIIIINDGSTDNSLNICNEYSQRHDFIKVFSNEKNRGPSIARNRGLDRASGKYIQFIDSDDFININSGELFYSLCEKYNLDMLRGKFHIVFDETKEIVSGEDYSKISCLNKPLYARDLFANYIKSSCYEVNPFLGFTKRDFLIKNDIYFTPGVVMEDNEFTLKVLTKDKNAIAMQLNYDFYTYRKRKGSITTTPCLKMIEDIIFLSQAMIEYIKNQEFDETLNNYANRAVSTLVYQAISIYGYLDKENKRRATQLLPKELLLFAEKNPFADHQKMKLILFNHYRVIVDIIYRIKRMQEGIL